jgi:hypothetical protein
MCLLVCAKRACFLAKANNTVYSSRSTSNVSFWHKSEINKNEEGHSSKQTVFRRDSETRAYMDVFTACLRGLCSFRCSLTGDKAQTIDSDLA